MQQDRSTLNPDGLIESWRSIAAFLGRDERTVQRWEKLRSLPVHRLSGDRGHVFAYRRELFSWLQSDSVPAQAHPSAALRRVTLVAPGTRAPFDSLGVPPSPSAETSSPEAAEAEAPRARWVFWIAAALFAVFLFFADVYHDRLGASRAALPNASAPGVPKNSGLITATVSFADQQQAHEFYLRGRYFWNMRTDASLQRALDSYTQAVVLNPNDAQAYAGLAATYELMPEYSLLPPGESFSHAVAAAHRAVELSPQSAEAHRVLGYALFYGEWKIPAAFAEFQRSLQLDPTDAEAHHWYATALFTLRRSAQARSEIARARELDPSSRSILADGILIDAVAGGDGADCVKRLRDLERAEPEFGSPARYISAILLSHRDFRAWIHEQKRGAELAHSAADLSLARAAERGWQRGGEHDMFSELRRVQQQAFAHGQSSGYDLALTCLRLGDREAAIGYLEAAYRVHDFRLLSIFRDPEDEVLRGEPRYEALRSAVDRQLDTHVAELRRPQAFDNLAGADAF